ncbi:hypothetical protein GGF43_003997 [Coemansia sp. RSA 2618]|nr:hypothetical protein GGF43_003997 [Coemansia sp. RSA 2618]
MALTEITLRANNRDSNSNGGRGPRQTTLFDLLGAAQRRHKRPRKAPGQENAHVENSRTEAADKAAKRVRANTPECIAPARPQKTHSTLAARPFAMCSSHSAQRIRQRQALAVERVFATGRLESMVSPTAGVFRLYADPESQAGVLPLSCKYSATGERLALVDEGGFVSVFDTHAIDAQADAPLEPVLRWKAHDNSAFDVEWRADGAQVATASADETLRLWDVERQQCLGSFVGHSQTVRSVSWRPSSQHCFTTASRDGSIMMWDTRCNKASVDGEVLYRPVNAINRAHHSLPSSKKPLRGKRNTVGASVTAIRHLRHNADLVASVGSTSEIVKFWDVRMKAPVRPSSLPNPVTSTLPLSSCASKRSRGTSSLSLDPDGTRLYSACNDNSVYVHNALAPAQPIDRLTAPEFECQSFNVGTSMSPCGRHLAAGSSSGSVVVWELDRFGANTSGRRAVLQAHTKEAGCVAWYPGRDKMQLATCGDDGVLRVWEENAMLAESAQADPMRRCTWGFSRVSRSSTDS